MTPELILTWHDCFTTVAQASATLAGLLFVGVTISLNHLLQGRGYLYRAWASISRPGWPGCSPSKSPRMELRKSAVP
ncbi:MAG TPA: hypothetical protein VG274_12875 [Rhizomicrobium sp.]|nr:hypothetical protein [Rhizomicrobium sp.]